MTAASATRAAAPHASTVRDGFVMLISRVSLRDDVLERRPRKYREDRVVEAQEGEVGPGVGRDARPDTADHERDREWQKEQREQHLAAPRGCGHRRDQRADGA